MNHVRKRFGQALARQEPGRHHWPWHILLRCQPPLGTGSADMLLIPQIYKDIMLYMILSLVREKFWKILDYQTPLADTLKSLDQAIRSLRA